MSKIGDLMEKHYSLDIQNEDVASGLSTLSRNIASSMSGMPYHADRIASVLSALSGPLTFLLNKSPDKKSLGSTFKILDVLKSQKGKESSFQKHIGKFANRPSVKKLAVLDDKSKKEIQKTLKDMTKLSKGMSDQEADAKEFKELSDQFLSLLKSMRFEIDDKQLGMAQRFPKLFGDNPKKDAEDFVKALNSIFTKPARIGA